MRLITLDGRNFRNPRYIISALVPGTEEPGEGSGLVVTMVRGDPVTLHGPLAQAMQEQLLSLADAPSPSGPSAPGEPPPGARVVVGHRVAVPDPANGGAASTSASPPGQ